MTRKIYSKILLKPTILTPVTDISTRVTLFNDPNHTLPCPIMIAPTAFHALATPQGEVATARGAMNAEVAYCWNFRFSSRTMDDIKEAAPTGVKWLHLYLNENPELMEEILRYAEKSKLFTAVIVTCDHPHDRVKDRTVPDMSHYNEEVGSSRQNNKFITNYDVFLQKNPRFTPRSTDIPDPQGSFIWSHLRHIVQSTSLPVVAKGIISPSDAVLAVQCGCKGVVVSNHGGRQIGGVVPAIVALRDVIAAVGGRNGGIDVWLDSGVREGTDIIKALALGAKGVLVGRPALWGLIWEGEKGVEKAMKILKDNLKADMQSLGKRDISELDESVIWCVPKVMRREKKNSSTGNNSAKL
eukprot:TRINITY_DN4235_c0_g1_i3.p1 TRINITY_DN4235_c0_g1~~TRINITY_DN4235_c0_g1_i3.p1  ORF type:complete len:410 (-),score=91.03 TRINITY_DN4235_c0_g1_i3:81-1145(-)